MRRSQKIAVWTGASLIGVVTVLLSALLIIANTDSGRVFIAREVADLTHGRVELTGIHGSFPATLALDRLELRDTAGLWLWAEHVSLRWNPGALLTRHVDVTSLHVGLLHVERAPVADSEPKSRSSASLPHADASDLTIDRLELGTALAGAPTSLMLKGAAHVLSLEQAEVHLTARRIAGDGEYELHAHLDSGSIEATLRAQEPAEGPLANLLGVPDAGALSVTASLKGARTAEDLALSVAAGPLKANADGRIDLTHGAADMSYSVTAPRMSPGAALGWEKIDLHGELHGPFTKLSADGHLLIEALHVPGGVRLAGLDARLQGDRGSLGLQATVDGLQIPGPAPALFKDSRLTVQASLRLDDTRRPLQLVARHPLFTLSATAVTVGTQSADVNVRLPDLRPFSALAGAQIAGDAQLTGHLDYTQASSAMSASVSSHLDGGDAAWAGLVRGGVTQLQTTLQMSDATVEVKQLQLTGSAVSLSASGTMARTGEQRVRARLDASLPILNRLSPALAGDLKVTGSVAGPRQDLSAEARVTANLSVHGSPPGTLTARVEAKGLPQIPQGTVAAAGQLDGSPLQLEVEVQSASNAGYHAVIRHGQWKSANVSGDMTLGRQLADARGVAQFRVGQLSDFDRIAGQPLAGSVNGAATLSYRPGKPVAQLDIEARNVVAGGITANARLHADGPMNALAVALDADSPAVAGQPARMKTTMVVNLSASDLQLASLDAFLRKQELRLLNPAQIQFADGLKIHNLKLGMQDASVSIDGEISPALNVHASAKNIGPALVNAFVPDLLAAGTANADAALRGTIAAPTGTVHVQAQNVRSGSPTARGLPALNLSADARLHADAADVDAQLTTGVSRLALSGKAPLVAGGAADLKLAGSLDLALANPLLEAGGRHITGAMTIDTTLTGTLADPQLAGTVKLSNGSVKDYTQGISLTDLSGVLTGDKGVLHIEQLTARAATGSVAVRGTVGVLQPKLPVQLTLTARNAQAIASNIVTANVEADLQISGTAQEHLDVDGKIRVNRADISIPRGLPPEVAVLDVERDGVVPPPPTRSLVIALQLDIAAPNRILVSGRGLDAEMGGELHIRGTTSAPVITGGFELQRGFFTLANSRLTFSSGTVTFDGSGLQQRLDPSLDFTAQTQAADVTAIVRITGVADAPHIELTSTPELPSDEILSRLLFGESAAQLTGLQLVQTGAALATLRGGGDGPSLNPLTRIQKALGLDRLSVGSAASTTSSQQSGASVEAGRYVSSRVYVGVKQGTTGASQVDVDVDLTRNLKLQAQLGNGTATAQGVTPENDPGSSLGLAYQFEY